MTRVTIPSAGQFGVIGDAATLVWLQAMSNNRRPPG